MTCCTIKTFDPGRPAWASHPSMVSHYTRAGGYGYGDVIGENKLSHRILRGWPTEEAFGLVPRAQRKKANRCSR